LTEGSVPSFAANEKQITATKAIDSRTAFPPRSAQWLRRIGGPQIESRLLFFTWCLARRFPSQPIAPDGQTLPRLPSAKRPVFFIDENHVDHDVIRAYAKLAVGFVGNLPIEGELNLFSVADGARHLDQDEIRRPIHVEEMPVIDEIVRRVLVDDDETVAIRSL